MTEQSSAPAPPKKRGVAFPQLSLEASVEAIVAMGQHGADHSQDAAAAYMGHQTTNSGAFRTKLAALRDWGLIKRGDKDRVILSDLAKQLVLEAPDHAQARPLLLAAFESCGVFDQLYEDSAKNIAQDLGRFRTVVVMRHNVATDQADKFIECFVESALYAGLATVEGTQVTLLPRGGVPVDEPVAVPANDVYAPFRQQPPPNPIPPYDQALREAREAELATLKPAIPTALRQTWPIDGGEIEFVIRTPKAMPPTIYALMADMAEVAAKMEKLLKAPDESTAALADEVNTPAIDGN